MLQSSSVSRVKRNKWPENLYTREIVRPKAGVLNFAIQNAEDGYYALFFNEITKEQGETYIQDLKDIGFQTVTNAQDFHTEGILLKKKAVYVSISITEGSLGIYIHLPAA